MPSHTAAEALIRLHADGGSPWMWPVWQERTGIIHGLFPPDDQHLPKGWSREDANDIKSYFHQYIQIDDERARIKFARGTNDGAVPGRKKWAQFVAKNWPKWDIHALIVEGLLKNNVHPISLLIESGSLDPKNWPLATLYVPIALDTIGLLVFGSEAFNDSEILPLERRICLTYFVQRSWARLREKVAADRKRLDETETAALKAFDSK
jgi:TATA-binding protein-associated factor